MLMASGWREKVRERARAGEDGRRSTSLPHLRSETGRTGPPPPLPGHRSLGS